MINGKKVLAYLPARSGSKSIINKNIVDLGGMPLMAHSIIAAKKSKYIDRLIISTDSREYANLAEIYGAEAPFLRPVELATDTAIEMDTTLHLIQWIEVNDNNKYDIIVRLEPTSPLRITEDIDKAIQMLDTNEADSIITVTEADTPPDWINTLGPNNSMVGFRKKSTERMNRQQMPKYYKLDGSVYVATISQIKNKKSWYDTLNSFASITPKNRGIDIDTELDLEMARVMFSKLGGKELNRNS